MKQTQQPTILTVMLLLKTINLLYFLYRFFFIMSSHLYLFSALSNTDWFTAINRKIMNNYANYIKYSYDE